LRPGNILYVLSGLLFILSASFLFPLLFSISLRDGLHFLFAFQMIGMFGLAFLLRHLFPKPTELSLREGFLAVSLTWVLCSLLGALPFMISGAIPSLTDAFFETMSGFTTTGASILTDIEALPRSLLVWRSTTHWLGGMGVIALAVAILPALGVGASQLFKAEAPGPIKEKISPRISETAKLLWIVYLLFSVVETFLLMLGGLDFFESLCTTFGTMATGGFSPRNASIAAYNSPYIDYVVIVFMFLAGANFNLHYWALRGKITAYRDSEFRFYTSVTLLAVGIIVFARWVAGTLWSESMIRSSLFQTVSVVTTTGFITDDYEAWPLVTQIILLLLMFIGGCTASTGGAIKNVRVYVLFKYLLSELKKVFHPHGVFPVKVRDKSLADSTVSNIVGFIILTFLFSSWVSCAWQGWDSTWRRP